MADGDPLYFPALRLLRRTLELPRRVLPEVPFLSSLIALPGEELEVGQERVPPGEAEMIRVLVEMMTERHKRSYPPGVRPMQRDFHTKAHGCVRATFTVVEDLPAEYRYGLFACTGVPFDAILRFSNGQRAVESDDMPTPHGLAIKVLGVPSDDPDGAKERTQDFLLADFPVNLLGDVADALEFYQAEAAGKPQAYFFSPLPPRLHARRFAIGALSSLGRVDDVLDLTYYSQTPYRLGPRQACKYIVRPAHRSRGRPPRREGDDNFLRARLVERLSAKEPVVLHFFVQRQLHPTRQPIEDASIEWDEREARPVHAATLELLPYDVQAVPFTSPWCQWCCERLSFNPWTALPASRPLGGINRLRKAVYDAISQLRHDANGVQRREPASFADYLAHEGW